MTTGWIIYYTNRNGNNSVKTFPTREEAYAFADKLDKRIEKASMRNGCVQDSGFGYILTEFCE